MGREVVKLALNGIWHEIEVPTHHSLLHVLRERLAQTSPKVGCNMGVCGACTVLLDGTPVNSCLILAVDTDGASITTADGLLREGELHPVQAAFLEAGAVQCGFCIPGFVLTAVSIVEDGKELSDAELRRRLAGNLCRCTGYTKIIEAVRLAQDAVRACKAVLTDEGD